MQRNEEELILDAEDDRVAMEAMRAAARAEIEEQERARPILRGYHDDPLGPDDRLGMHGQICAVLRHADGTREVFIGKNIITDAGDRYYAERAANQIPAQFVDTAGVFTGILGLATAATVGKDSDYADITALVASSSFAPDSGYPKTNDDDADNPGTIAVDVVTYRRSYTTAQANATNISHAFITEANPVTASPLISVAAFGAPFTKTSSDTLKLYVNHTFLGS